MTTLEDQLKNKANNIEGGTLYLFRCMACPDAGPRGRENYAFSIAWGQCSWCGWKQEKQKDKKEDG